MKVNAKDESIADDSVMESANEKLESFIVRWFFERKAVEEESERLVNRLDVSPLRASRVGHGCIGPNRKS